VRVCYLDLDGTLMGPGGCLVRGADGGFSDAGVRALGILAGRGIPVVLVSGRASAEGVAWVAAASAGSLRLVDNGVIGPGGERVYHLLPSPAGKAPAVARDLAVRDAEPAACLAVGDSLEDLELAAVVGHVALVGNARAVNGGALEDAAGVWVTEGCYGAGVLEADEAWLAGSAPRGVPERRAGAPRRGPRGPRPSPPDRPRTPPGPRSGRAGDG